MVQVHVHQFWYQAPAPPYALVSLQSMRQHHASVTLWSYTADIVVPAGVVVRNANEVMPLTQFEQLFTRVRTATRHQQIAMASDFFRFFLLVFVIHENPSHTVAYVDCDTLALRPFPLPDDSGLVFSSVPAKQTGPYAPRRAQLADVGLPHHFSIGCLIADKRGLPFMIAVTTHWTVLLKQQTIFRQYTALMVAANRIRQQLQYTNVYPPLAFCPLLPFAIAALTRPGSAVGFVKYGTECPSAQVILASSYVVHLFGSKQYLDLNFGGWPPTSMLGTLFANNKAPKKE